jgi:hypothetical protein
MKTTVHNNRQEPSSLLRAIQLKVGDLKMQEAAAKAYLKLKKAYDGPMEGCEGIVAEHAKLPMATGETQELPDTIIAAALLEIIRANRQRMTAVEKVEAAIGLLSDQYQADW